MTEKAERCPWAETDPYSLAYHDERWCVPVHEDQELFAMLILEGLQAGLSWQLILKREEGIRSLTDNLNPETIARYTQEDEERLCKDPRMIRSKAKIHAMVTNAIAFLCVQKEWGSFDAYIWHFTDGNVIDHRLVHPQDMPAKDALSQSVSTDLKRRGFRFTGPVITYSYLQAIGVINDHLITCPFHDHPLK
ncbi:DNA-3-methyladenine glycosylase I [Galactobacillus timonensis]|uniref:DNA-3-methyladenine glycosylase I n=1 Tax=Galactobacillus timonensis TaxID=2041840 RepID=UPI00240A5DCA|nr:DNA-3-methyladenine glycosylase I [Galactobacillus timonensis]MDD6370088.1 DNA-3-methyladenine glycosylase I [Galactobacillus timonensis]